MRTFPTTSCALALVLATACADSDPVASAPASPTDTLPPGPEPTVPPEETVPTVPDDGCDRRPLFLLAGQSNMEGNVNEDLFVTLLDELGTGSDDDLRARLHAALDYFYFVFDDGYASYGYTEEMAELQITELIAYRDQGLLGPDILLPLKNSYCAFNDAPLAPLEVNCGYPFGPELMLGHARAAAGRPGTTYVKVARGGTTLYADWRSPSSGRVGTDYEDLRKRIGALATNPAGVHPACATEECHWAAFIWFQGENDSFEQTSAAAYEANLVSLLTDVRGEVGDPDLPVIIVQTGAWAQSLYFGDPVADAQQRVVDKDPHARLVATDDLSGFYHYDPAAQLIIGKRIADALDDALPCD